LDTFDFWAIAPEEGKFAMAAEFHKTRAMAIVWQRWILANDGVV